MARQDKFAREVVRKIVEEIDIPDSHYEAATERYESLGKHLQRDESTLKRDDPQVYCQGSFRIGTVVKPVDGGEGYDLDLVCELADLEKYEDSQANLKDRVGVEVGGYAETYKMKEPTPGRRCWKLEYRGAPGFHIDVLPAVPEDQRTKHAIAGAVASNGGGGGIAETAIGITDKTHPRFRAIATDWQTSNPHGFAGWFEGRMRAQAEVRMRQLVEAGFYAKVDEVPVYRWKTQLQRAVQVLKRHRDVTFKGAEGCRIKPISAIISTLAARAYAGETDVLDALTNIVDKMPGLVHTTAPRVPNPANPAEDFADKWRDNPKLEEAFFRWVKLVRADLQRLVEGVDEHGLRALGKRFGINPGDEWIAATAGLLAVATPATPRSTPSPARQQIMHTPGQWSGPG